MGCPHAVSPWPDFGAAEEMRSPPYPPSWDGDILAPLLPGRGVWQQPGRGDSPSKPCPLPPHSALRGPGRCCCPGVSLHQHPRRSRQHPHHQGEPGGSAPGVPSSVIPSSWVSPSQLNPSHALAPPNSLPARSTGSSRALSTSSWTPWLGLECSSAVMRSEFLVGRGTADPRGCGNDARTTWLRRGVNHPIEIPALLCLPSLLILQKRLFICTMSGISLIIEQSPQATILFLALLFLVVHRAYPKSV